jgi:hypothetical protein
VNKLFFPEKSAANIQNFKINQEILEFFRKFLEPISEISKSEHAVLLDDQKDIQMQIFSLLALSQAQLGRFLASLKKTSEIYENRIT